MEAALISRPGDGVGDSHPLVRVRAAPHVVVRLVDVARVGDFVVLSAVSSGCVVTEK